MIYVVAAIALLVSETAAFAPPPPLAATATSSRRDMVASSLPETASDILWTPSWKTGQREEVNGPLSKYCEDL